MNAPSCRIRSARRVDPPTPQLRCIWCWIWRLRPSRLPVHLERFARIAEIVDGDEERRRLGRERFKSYRDLKLSLEAHQLDDGGPA
jgi:hypothetical protein